MYSETNFQIDKRQKYRFSVFCHVLVPLTSDACAPASVQALPKKLMLQEHIWVTFYTDTTCDTDATGTHMGHILYRHYL